MTEWKNKRVFISGGSGVIGTALANDLIKEGALLFIGDLKPKPEIWTDLAYREGDLITLNKQEISHFAPEVYFHLAATFERSVETSTFWQENFHHNVLLSHHLLSILKDLPSLKKIIFASSYLIYNPDSYLFATPQNYPTRLNETGNIAPRNLCGMAKMFHEQEIFFIKKFKPDLQIINARIFRSYGKNSKDIISRWIRALLNHEQLSVYCPEGRFDFVYAEDVAKGLKALSETQFNGIVNIGSGHSRTINELLEILKQCFGKFYCQIEKGDNLYEASQADMSLFKKFVKTVSFRSLEDVIPDLIAFEKTRLLETKENFS